MTLVGASSAKEVWSYYNAREDVLKGRAIIEKETNWQKEFSFPWDSNLNYPTFLKCYDGQPVLYFKAVQIIATFEAAARANGGRDVYEVLDIIPCSYNIDGFNKPKLDMLKTLPPPTGFRNFEAAALAAMSQREPELLNDLAEGYCATKETCLALKAFLDKFIADSGRYDLIVGDVRPHPGRRKLGKNGASEHEYVDVHSPKPRKAGLKPYPGGAA